MVAASCPRVFVVATIEHERGRLDILVNSMCPGWVKLEMGGFNAIREIEDSADTAIWLATLPDDGPHRGLLQGPGTASLVATRRTNCGQAS